MNCVVSYLKWEEIMVKSRLDKSKKGTPLLLLYVNKCQHTMV